MIPFVARRVLLSRMTYCESFNLITSAKPHFPSKVPVTGGLSQMLQARVSIRSQAPGMLASSCWHLSWETPSAKGSCFTKGYAPSPGEPQDSARDRSKDSSSSKIPRGQAEVSAVPAWFTSPFCSIPQPSPPSRCYSQERSPGNCLAQVSTSAPVSRELDPRHSATSELGNFAQDA